MQKSKKKTCNFIIIAAYLVFQILLTLTIDALKLHLCIHLIFVGLAFLTYVVITLANVL